MRNSCNLENFRQTAKELNTSISIVSKYIKDLETHFQAELFNRTTRSVTLTKEAKLILPRVKEILQIENEIKQNLIHQNNYIGRLKVGIPNTYFFYKMKAICQKLTNQEGISIDWIIGNHLPSLLSENFDVIIFCGSVPSGDFYAKKIDTWKKYVCASPLYLEKYGKPKTPSDFLKHQCLDHSHNYHETWILDDNYPINISHKASTSDAIVQMAENHLGLCYMPSFTLEPYIQKGTLVKVLEDYTKKEFDVYLVSNKSFKENKKLQAMIKLFD